MAKKIIVLGIGNILMSDEGIGVRAVEAIKEKYTFSENVEIYDGGTTGMMGLLPIIEEADHLIVIDAVNGPGEPGALYRYTLDELRLNIPKKLSPHDIGFLECLSIAEINGRLPESVVIIGVKPEDIKTRRMELSEPVAGKIGNLVSMTLAELKTLGVEPLR